MAEKVLATPAEPRRLIMTREAAKIIGCGMSNVRWLAKTGRIKSWTLGPRSVAYDLEEVKAYKKRMDTERAKAQKEGRQGAGKPRQGFAGY